MGGRKQGFSLISPSEIKKRWILIQPEKSHSKKLIPPSGWMVKFSPCDKLSWAISVPTQYISMHPTAPLTPPQQEDTVFSLLFPPPAASEEINYIFFKNWKWTHSSVQINKDTNVSGFDSEVVFVLHTNKHRNWCSGHFTTNTTLISDW